MAITFSINGGVDASKFTINATTGVLAFVSAPDFEAPTDVNGDNIYEVTVRATDSDGLFDAKTILVTVTNVSEGGALPPLTSSGSITSSANNQIIENKLVTGMVTINGHSGVTVRNCHIRHSGSQGLLASNCSNLTIEDCKFTYTNAASGQNPNSGEVKNVELNRGGPITMRRCTFEGAHGIYAYSLSGMFTGSFLQCTNPRSGTVILRGGLIQMNACTGGGLIEDFSCECDNANSWPEDLVNIHYNTGTYTIRRGLLTGGTGPIAVSMMVEHTNGTLVEDVDVVQHFNGAFSSYDGTVAAIFRRCRAKNQSLTNQGRGNPGSSYCNFVSSNQPEAVSGTRFEQCKYFNVSTNLTWHDSTIVVRDITSGDFTPRAPIRNRTPGT